MKTSVLIVDNDRMVRENLAKALSDNYLAYKAFNGKIVKRNNMNAFIGEGQFRTLLNTGNYLISKNTIVNIKYDESIMKLISACDVIYFNLLAFQQNNAYW